MKLRRLVAAACVVSVLAMLVYRSAVVPAADDTGESVAVRYAKAQLRFAELTVQKAEAMNRRVPGTLVQSVIMQFADEVELGKLRVTAAQRGADDSMTLSLQRAEFNVRSAEAKLQKAVETNQRVPGA